MNETIPPQVSPTPEAAPYQSESLQALHTLRDVEVRRRAVVTVGDVLVDTNSAVSPIKSVVYKFLREFGASSWHDGPLHSPFLRNSLRVLSEAVGEDPGRVLLAAWHLNEGEETQFASPDGTVLELDGYKPGRVSWRVKLDDGRGQSRESGVQRLQEAIEAPSRRIIEAQQELRHALDSGQLSAYSSRVFSWATDIDVITVFLSQGTNNVPGLAKMRWVDPPPTPEACWSTQTDALYSDMSAHYPGDYGYNGRPGERMGIHFDEHGNIAKILFAHSNSPGVYFGLVPEQAGYDMSQMSFRIGFEIVPEETRAILDSNDQYHPETVPFVESAAARSLLGAFDVAGLHLNADTLGMLTELGSTRYGHAYSELTREIAKLVDDPDRPLTKLFDGEEASIRESILRLQYAGDNMPAQVVIELLRGVVNRNANESSGVVLQASSERIDMRNGSCKDIEYYLADGYLERADSASSPLFVKSSYTVPTVMTLGPTVLNGVLLPPGSLLTRRPDGTYLFMRITGFAFDDQQALDAFGAQEAENRNSDYGYKRQSVRAQFSTSDSTAR